MVNFNDLTNTNYHIQNLIFDFSSQFPVNYLQCFQIVKVKNFSLELLTTIILNCFVSPALPRVDPFVASVEFNEFGNFTLNCNNGLIYLVSLETSRFYLFFLFRTTSYGDSSDSNSPIYKMEEAVAQHDRFFSFEVFCKVNSLKIQPLLLPYKSPRWQFDQRRVKLSFFYCDIMYPCSNQTNQQESSFLLFDKLKFYLNKKILVLSSFFCFFPDSQYDFALLSHESLYFFYNSSFSFRTLVNYSISNSCINWKFGYLRENHLKALASSHVQPENLAHTLAFKPFSLFESYCQFSQRPMSPAFYVRWLSLFFNFNAWKELAIKYNWYTVCGYYILDSVIYAKQVYEFMQFKILNFNVQCTFSHLREGRLYFWMLFRSKEDFSRFRKACIEIPLVYKIKKLVKGLEDLEKTSKFLKRYTSYRPINLKKYYNIYGNLDICDYRLASYYVGIYSKDYYISSLLTGLVYEDNSSFYSLESVSCELTVTHLDVGTENFVFEKLKKETGLDIEESVWFFCNPKVPYTCFFQHPRD